MISAVSAQTGDPGALKRVDGGASSPLMPTWHSTCAQETTFHKHVRAELWSLGPHQAAGGETTEGLGDPTRPEPAGRKEQDLVTIWQSPARVSCCSETAPVPFYLHYRLNENQQAAAVK